MHHFLAGAAATETAGGGMVGVLGTMVAGVVVEVGQAWSRNPNQRASAFNREDLVSNNWGALFVNRYYDPQKPLAEQIEAFLQMSGAITPDELERLYRSVYDAIPEADTRE